MRAVRSVVTGFWICLFAFLTTSGLTACQERELEPKSVTPRILAHGKIYIDSVPQNAQVFAVPKPPTMQEMADSFSNPDAKRDESSKKLLGTTPLVLDQACCPTMTFAIMMDLSDLLKELAKAPSTMPVVAKLEQWRIGQHVGASLDPFFEFDTSTSQSERTVGGSLVALGPVYELRWPESNRLVAWFIPKGVSPSTLTAVWNKQYTLPIDSSTWTARARQEFLMPTEQGRELLASLSHFGRYQGALQHPDSPREWISITMAGGIPEVATFRFW